MADTAETQFGTAVIWGIAAEATQGSVQDVSYGAGGKQKEYNGIKGGVKTVVTYDKNKTIRMSVLLTTVSKEPLAKGTQFEYNGDKFYVTDCNIDWTTEDAQKMTISGRTYPDIASA